MKFLVDELPYYNDDCILADICEDRFSKKECPRYWDKEKVCSDTNPHQCNYLIEWYPVLRNCNKTD
jgi:hypothetical protein